MPQIDLWVLGAELILLAVALAGTGEGFLRLTLRVLRTPVSLGWVERALLGLYIPLGILYVIASLPLPLFSLATVVGVLAVGWAMLLGSELRRGLPVKRLTGLIRILHPGGRGWIAAVVLGGSTLGLLAFEVVVMGGVDAPNTFDGSTQVDFVVLLLRNHTVPWTLAPFAPNAGVVYPQGTAVALATGTLLLGWPIVMSPAFLSPLFAALSVPAGYVLGTRLVGNQSKAAIGFGLTLAVTFATLSTWPRFLVGGSYDFLFSVPLLFVLSGGAVSLSRPPPAPWRKVVLYAAGAGVLGAFSLVSLQFTLCFLVVLIIACNSMTVRTFVSGLGRAATIAAVSIAFLARSIVGRFVWWSYPGHTLTEVGGVLNMTPPAQPSTPIGSLTGLADPFLFRPVDVWLSPFPLLKAEMAALLAAGLLMIATSLSGPHPRAGQVLPRQLARALALALVTDLLLLGLFVVEPGIIEGAASPAIPTNTDELSIMLFVIYTLIASVPMLCAWRALTNRGVPERTSRPRQHRVVGPRPRSQALGQPLRFSLTILALLVLVVPIVSGSAVTISQAPKYLDEITGPLGNVTQADYAALEWLGAHLPACSGVLVAPGSAGELLPAYSNARLVFPMDPTPANLSYQRAIRDLTSGFANASTLADLRALEVTEVLVTGRSNLLWMPFQVAPLQSSPSFELEFQNGDASVFEFDASATAIGCPPSV